MVWAVLPLKDFVDAKQRLSGVLTPSERRQLFYAMVEDVLTVLANHPEIEQTVIVSDDPDAQLLAQQFAINYWPESNFNSPGLSALMNAVAERLNDQGVETLLAVHGDLPQLTHDEISQLIASHRQQQVPAVAIAPDVRATGSNCVIATPSNAISFQYGENSLEKHRQQAISAGVDFTTEALGFAARDIDYPDDLCQFAQLLPINSFSGRYLEKSKIGERIQLMLNTPTVAEPSAFAELHGSGKLVSTEQLKRLANDAYYSDDSIADMMRVACELRDEGFQNVVSYSRKIFIPLTQLCRDVCHYCTFAHTPKHVKSPYMSVEEVLETVRAGVAQGCKEALFTLGEKPELRYSAARDALAELGFATTLEYVAFVAKRVFEETGILPHINAGCMSDEEIAMLRPVSASMGIMLESGSERLCEKGMPHYGSPDKHPSVRLQTIAAAGRAAVPFTSGILIGIGETRLERIESLLALRELHYQHGHLQEIIIQNFRAKDGTKMSQAPEPDLKELLWTIAVARIIFGPTMSIQAPPNLSPGVLPQLLAAGINDWGGVSPVSPDFVNPEAPWPHLDKLAKETANAGKYLQERLTIYPRYALQGHKWLDPALQQVVMRQIDTEGFPRTDVWSPGESIKPPAEVLSLIRPPVLHYVSEDIKHIVSMARAAKELTEAQLVRLFQARGEDFAYLCQQADQVRSHLKGDAVTYVVNRNINYTNICYFKCQFCAFSKGKLSENLRGRPYDLGHDEISRRCQEAWQRGATEVCMQGGIHPDYSGKTYLDILATVKQATPDMHVHAFSPLEVWQGAATANLSLAEFLAALKDAGLDTLPGTAAEILDDEVRAILCPDKINTQQWFEVMEEAHRQGFKTTATIMYGHVEGLQHWARHLLSIRTLQQKTGGFTEFVPLPFVHMEAPLYLKGKARSGPTFRESVLMHVVARLVLSPFIENIQASWVKMGEEGVAACLQAGVNDLGGTLMNETITRSAGAAHGQEFSVKQMNEMILKLGRQPQQRSTVYGSVSEERVAAAMVAAPLQDVVNTPVKKQSRKEALIASS